MRLKRIIGIGIRAGHNTDKKRGCLSCRGVKCVKMRRIHVNQLKRGIS